MRTGLEITDRDSFPGSVTGPNKFSSENVIIYWSYVHANHNTEATNTKEKAKNEE